MTEYYEAQIFGGAIAAAIPGGFGDVSEIRQVPDNQEVFLDAEGFSNIAFDILERVDLPDAEALEFHFHDVAAEDREFTKIWTTGQAHFSKLPQGTTALTMFATTPANYPARGQPNEADFFGILLTLVRLEELKTDIILMVNVPHINGQYDPAEIDPEKGKNGPLIEAAFQYRQKLLETFEIKDWDLFVNDEDEEGT